MSSTIVRVKTEHTHEITKLFDVLKEVLNDVKIDFIRDENQKPGDPKTEKQESDSDESDSDEDNKKKKPVKKGKKQDSDSEDDKKKKSKKKGKKQDSESEEKPKPKKKNTKKSNNDSDSESEEDSDEDDQEEEKKEDKKKSTGGIRILAVDEHQTLLIYAKLHANQFVDFYVKPQIHSIGLDLLVLHKFMKTVDRESIMTIQIDKDDEQFITFNLENNLKKNTAFYKQKLLDVDDDPKKLPQDAKFAMSVRMDTSDFRKICQEMSYFSEFVEITCTNKELTFKCQGDSTAYVKTFKNSETGVTITMQGKSKGLNMVQAIYHLKHLVTFGKCVGLCTEMQLLLKNDFPLFIHYTIGNLGKMIVGLSPVDEKTIKRDNDYDETNDKYYNSKNIKMKDNDI